MSRSRIIGTVEEAVEIEEALLGRKLPPSFRKWLLENNGQGLDDIHIYPVRDERDTRKTWESLSYLLEHEWAESVSEFRQTLYAHLLPFADAGNGDFYCFDYSVVETNDERPVVFWSHETGEVSSVATGFTAFAAMLRRDSPANG